MIKNPIYRIFNLCFSVVFVLYTTWVAVPSEQMKHHFSGTSEHQMRGESNHGMSSKHISAKAHTTQKPQSHSKNEMPMKDCCVSLSEMLNCSFMVTTFVGAYWLAGSTAHASSFLRLFENATLSGREPEMLDDPPRYFS